MACLDKLHDIRLAAVASVLQATHMAHAQHKVPPSSAMQHPQFLLVVQMHHWIFCLPAVTHWHSDHTGCLQQVVQAFPDAAVGMHELDAPYIVGGADVRALKGDNLANLVMRHLLPLPNSTAYPESKTLLLKGSAGDVADLFTYSNWLPKGILQFLHLPGHSPGQVAFVHQPSSSVLTADSVVNINALSGHAHLARPLAGSSLNLSAVGESIKTLADIDAQHFFPSHDNATGVTGKQLKMFAMA